MAAAGTSYGNSIAWRSGPLSSAPASSSSAPIWSRRRAASPRGALALPFPRHAADGGAGHGARARLHLLLQQPDQSVELPIYGTMAILVISHDHPLLHGRASDGGHRTKADGCRVRGGRRPRSSCRSTRLSAKVTVPVCLPAILDISIYLFVNAMTTVSAVVFLYSAAHHARLGRRAQHGRCGRRWPRPRRWRMMIFYTNGGVARPSRARYPGDRTTHPGLAPALIRPCAGGKAPRMRLTRGSDRLSSRGTTRR